MALTAPVELAKSSAQTITVAIKSGDTIFHGALVSIELATGRLTDFVDAATHETIGRVVGFDSPLQDDGSGTGNAGGTVKAIVDIEESIVKSHAVVGVTAETDVGDLVYGVDESVVTLTPGTNAAVGVILRWISATICDVLFFSYENMRAT